MRSYCKATRMFCREIGARPSMVSTTEDRLGPLILISNIHSNHTVATLDIRIAKAYKDVR